jgi:hypothetical protein
MDPVTLIVSALALGASAGLQSTVATAIGDAYSALRRILRKRYRDVDLTPVERRPESAAKRDSLAEDLDVAGAGADAELLAAARHLIEQVSSHAPDAAVAVGVDLERVHAAALRIAAVESAGTGVRVRDSDFTGDVDIRDVRAGPDRPQPRPASPDRPQT